MRHPATCALLIALAAAAVALPTCSALSSAKGEAQLWLPLALGRPPQPTATPIPSATPAPTVTATATPTITPKPTSTPTPRPDAELLSYSVFRPSAGSSSLYIVGEVRNNSTGLLGYIKARFTLGDATGAPIASDYALTSIAVLPPGLRSPFQVTLSDMTQPYASILPYLSWESSSSAPSLLTVTETGSYPAADIFHVWGWATNNTGSPCTLVEAIVTAYDNNGRVIGTGKGYTEPRNVEAGERTFFDIEVRYYAGKPAQCMARYEVMVVDD
jgi:hypothetical protein